MIKPTKEYMNVLKSIGDWLLLLGVFIFCFLWVIYSAIAGITLGLLAALAVILYIPTLGHSMRLWRVINHTVESTLYYGFREE